MSMVINTNTASMVAQAAQAKSSSAMDTAMERLSTGKRINTASDDAAGLAISSRMTAEITGNKMAIRNTADAQALIDTAEGAHDEVNNILQRMRELAVQASNDTYNSSDRGNLQQEIDALSKEIDRIASATDWGGKRLLNGSAGETSATSHTDTADFSFQIGSSVSNGDVAKISIGAISSEALGLATKQDSAPTLSNIRLQQAGSTEETTGILKSDGNVIRFEGGFTNNDVYTVNVNGETVTVTLSNTDGYQDNAAGFSAQLKDQILANAKLSTYLNVTDNGDGSVTLTQPASPVLTEALFTNNAGTNDNGAVTFEGNTVRFSGEMDGTDVVSFKVNGQAVSVTVAAAADAWNDDIYGVAAQVQDAIQNTVTGLKDGGVNVVNNGDGSLTITQSETPVIDTLNKTTGTEADPRMEWDSAGSTFTFTNAIFNDGVSYSANINGHTISITSDKDDGFANSATGLGDKWEQAINDANIAGITAANVGGVVTLTKKAVTANASITHDNGTAETSIATTAGYQTSATVTVTSTDDLSELGDTFEFDVMGHTFSVEVKDDGYSTILDGLAQRMKDAVDAAGLTGIDVTATSTATTAVITATMVPEVSDVGVSRPELNVSQVDGDIQLEGTVKEGDKVAFTLGSTNIEVTAYNSSKKDLASLISSAINESSGGHVASVNSDGSISVSKDTASANIMSSEAAAVAIQNIDAALETISAQRAELGAVSNRMSHTINNLTNVTTNLESSLSKIQDADFATETSNLTKAQILSQAATAMLAQANASKQSVLSLLQG